MAMVMNEDYRDVCAMVRKGTIVFEPDDDVRVALPDADGLGERDVFVHALFRDDEGDVKCCCRFYDPEAYGTEAADGVEDAFISLELLPGRCMPRLKEAVKKYRDLSLKRESNVRFLKDFLLSASPSLEMLDGSPWLRLPDGHRPSISISCGNGCYVDAVVDGLACLPYWQVSSPHVVCSCPDSPRNKMSVPLVAVSDLTVMDIAREVRGLAEAERMSRGMSRAEAAVEGRAVSVPPVEPRKNPDGEHFSGRAVR